jgi:hypothetical protein
LARLTRRQRLAKRIALPAYSIAFVIYFFRLFELSYFLFGTALQLVVDRLLLVVYVALWLFATATAVQATRILYGRGPGGSPRSLVLYVFLSVSTFIIAFAMAYVDISTADPEHAFNIKIALSPVSALYFSIITFATVGYGDIAPNSDLARLLVSAEVIFGMLYTVLILSVLAGFIQKRNQPATPTKTDVDSA